MNIIQLSNFKVIKKSFCNKFFYLFTRSLNQSVMNVFDRKTKRFQKNITASLKDYAVYDYIKDEVGWRVSDRLLDIKRKFNMVLDLGCGRGHIGKNLYNETVQVLHQCDMASDIIKQSLFSNEVLSTSLVVDEERIPFRKNTFDLVLSSLSLHWVNDLPGTLSQVYQILVNDGCFLGSMFGGDTLHELRVALYLAETQLRGGFSPHISPFTSAQDFGGLLQRAGFVMLTIDVDDIIVNYPNMKALMLDLKGMGENNCSWNRTAMLHRNVIELASKIYHEKFSNEISIDENKPDQKEVTIPALFQIIHFIAWKPDKSQHKAAKRGSAKVSIKDIDKLDNIKKEIEKLKTTDEIDERTKKNVDELEKSFNKAISENKNDYIK